MENGEPADIVYLHFQEAFDKVSYNFFKETKQVGDKKGHGMEMCLKDRTEGDSKWSALRAEGGYKCRDLSC